MMRGVPNSEALLSNWHQIGTKRRERKWGPERKKPLICADLTLMEKTKFKRSKRQGRRDSGEGRAPFIQKATR